MVTYYPSSLHQQLNVEADNFIRRYMSCSPRRRNTVHASKMFEWYCRDFGKSQSERLLFLASLAPNSPFGEVVQEFKDRLDSVSVKYDTYTWDFCVRLPASSGI